ncbi:MAG: hypothetical protein WBG08_11870 [Litorimonas sp.]
MFTSLDTEYGGRAIRVTNHWILGLRLYIDGGLVARRIKPFHLNRYEPLVEEELATDEGIVTLRVFVEAIETIKIALMVDDEVIATTHPEAVA